MGIENELINNTIEPTIKSNDLLLITIEDKHWCKRYENMAKKMGWKYTKNADGTICGYMPRESLYFKAK